MPDAQQQHGRGQRAARELVDEVEQRRLGPVRILEGQHERPVGGERREEHPEGPRRRVGQASPPSPSVAAIVAAAARPSSVAGMTAVSGRPRSAWSTISRSGQ